MGKRLGIAAILAASLFAASVTARETAFRQDAMRIVASIRQYKPGPERSYFHLALYDGSGKLLRRLTTQDGVDDTSPTLSPDGKQLVFYRVQHKPKPGLPENGWYLLKSLSEGKPIRLANDRERPAWTAESQQRKATSFNADAARAWHETIQLQSAATYEEEIYPLPDNFGEIILRDFHDDVSDSDSPTQALHVFFRDNQTRKMSRLSTYPGFQEIQHPDPVFGNPFLFSKAMKGVFFSYHRNSTEHERNSFLDLKRKAFHILSENGGCPWLAPDTPGLFYVCEQFYQDLGDGRTVNCSYLDYWNPRMERTRFSPALAVIHSASVWIPGHKACGIPGIDTGY